MARSRLQDNYEEYRRKHQSLPRSSHNDKDDSACRSYAKDREYFPRDCEESLASHPLKGRLAGSNEHMKEQTTPHWLSNNERLFPRIPQGKCHSEVYQERYKAIDHQGYRAKCLLMI